MRRSLWVALGCALLLVGCAAVQQGKADYDLGKQTLAEQGTSGTAEATKLVEPFLPFVPEPLKPFALPIVSVIGAVVTWNVGRRQRKGQAATKPISGWLGQKAGLEFLIQQVVTVLVGGFRIVELIATKGKTAVATVLPVKEEPPV